MMDIQEWQLTPYVGVGPIKFGMSEQDVCDILGEPETRSEQDEKTDFYYYDSTVIIIFSDGRVKSVGMSPSSEVTPVIGEVLVFSDEPKDVLPALEILNGEIYESYGFLIFEKLGLTITGLHDGDDSQLAINAFQKEALKSFDLAGVQKTPITFIKPKSKIGSFLSSLIHRK